MAETYEVASAFVRLRPKADPNFARDAEQQLGSPLKSIALGVGSAFAAIKVGGFLRGAITEQREAARLGRQTEAVLRSTGGAAHVTAGDIDRLANSLSKVVGIDDEVIQASENVLLRFTQIRNEAGKGNDIFNRATKSALDLSAAYGRDLTSTSIALGRALNNPLQGLLALQRVGVSFTQSQRDQIKALVESGHTLDAQRAILDQITARFGGAAKAAADPAAKLDVAIKNLKESVGAGLVPTMNIGAGGLTKLADGFSHLPSPVQASVVAFGGMALLAGPMLTVARNLGLMRAAFARLPLAVYDASAAVDTFGAALGASGLLAGGALAASVGVIAGSLIHASNDAKKRTEAMYQAMLAAGDAADGAAVKFSRASLSVEPLAKSLQAGGVSIGEATKAIIHGGKEFQDLQSRLANNPVTRNAGLALAALRDSYVASNKRLDENKTRQHEVGAETSNTTAKQKAQADAVKALGDAYTDQLQNIIPNTIGRYLDQANAAEAVGTAESGLADAITGTGSAASDTTKKIKTYGDAVAAVFDSVLATDRAHIDVRQSLQKLTETTTSFQQQASASARGLIRLDGQQASSADDVHGALLDVISAREAEVDAEAKSGEIADTAQARHQALVDSLLDLRNQYPALAGDIDKYITAAKKIPELPLEDANTKAAKSAGNLADAALRVVTALKEQASADDDPIRGLENMDGLLKGLIDKYKNFPDAAGIFTGALATIDTALAQEAALLGITPAALAQLLTSGISGNLLTALANPATGGAVAGLIATPRAAGGPVRSGVPYWVGEHHAELFVPSTSGTIVANPQTDSSSGGVHVHGDITLVARDAESATRDLFFELRTLAKGIV